MKAELNLSGMNGSSCAVKIKETLENTAGVHRAEVSYHDAQAIVEFDDQVVQPATLVKKVQDLGYQATPAGN